MIGIAVPIILIFLMGYGISMDVKRVPTAVVMEDASPTVAYALVPMLLIAGITLPVAGWFFRNKL